MKVENYMSPSCISVLARSKGSKRILKKNMKYSYEELLIVYSIEVTIKFNLFDKIAEILKKYGTTVPFLCSGELSDDSTGADIVKGHIIKYLKM